MEVEERSYAVPFDEVWRAALAVVAGLRSLEVESADPHAGAIRAVGRTLLLRRARRASLDVRLDEFGLTRVAARVEPGGPRAAGRLLRRLERRLRAPDGRGG